MLLPEGPCMFRRGRRHFLFQALHRPVPFPQLVGQCSDGFDPCFQLFGFGHWAGPSSFFVPAGSRVVLPISERAGWDWLPFRPVVLLFECLRHMPIPGPANTSSDGSMRGSGIGTSFVSAVVGNADGSYGSNPTVTRVARASARSPACPVRPLRPAPCPGCS